MISHACQKLRSRITPVQWQVLVRLKYSWDVQSVASSTWIRFVSHHLSFFVSLLLVKKKNLGDVGDNLTASFISPKSSRCSPHFPNWVCVCLSFFVSPQSGVLRVRRLLRIHFFQTVWKPQEVFSHATILLPEIYSRAGLFRRGPGPPLHFLRGPKGRPRSGPAPQGLVYRQWRNSVIFQQRSTR